MICENRLSVSMPVVVHSRADTSLMKIVYILGIVSILHLSFGFFIYLYMQGISRAVGTVVVAPRTCVPLLNIVHLYPGSLVSPSIVYIQVF